MWKYTGRVTIGESREVFISDRTETMVTVETKGNPILGTHIEIFNVKLKRGKLELYRQFREN